MQLRRGSKPNTCKEVLVAYNEFIRAYPDAEQIPELLFKSGEVLKGLGAHLKSAKHFMEVHTQFPNAKVAPIALFHQAHCFEALDQHLTAKNTGFYRALSKPSLCISS